MKGIREIRRRIRAVRNTAQITKALQLVASSKMKRAQDAAVAGRAYALLLAHMMESAADKADTANLPLFVTRPLRKRGILLISTDKGLCGPLNSNLFRLVAEIPREAASYVSVGRKGTQFLARSGRDLLADFPVSDRIGYNEVRPVVEYITQAYLDGKVDTIEVIHSSFINTLRQDPTLLKLAPFSSLRESIAQLREKFGQLISDDLEETKSDDGRMMLYEPSPEDILERLPVLFLKQSIYQLLLGSKASEHSARMVAMKNATDNAKQLTTDLTLEYNKARQGSITQEILEIAAAAAAGEE
jgi:F-type H+-transporting ATPase subunit gamma